MVISRRSASCSGVPKAYAQGLGDNNKSGTRGTQ